MAGNAPPPVHLPLFGLAQVNFLQLGKGLLSHAILSLSFSMSTPGSQEKSLSVGGRKEGKFKMFHLTACREKVTTNNNVKQIAKAGQWGTFKGLSGSPFNG